MTDSTTSDTEQPLTSVAEPADADAAGSDAADQEAGDAPPTEEPPTELAPDEGASGGDADAVGDASDVDGSEGAEDDAGAEDGTRAPALPLAEPGDGADQPGEQDRLDRLEREGDIAADYLEELLDIADLDGDLDMDVEGDRAAVSIVGADLRQLVGRDGEVLEALQELTRLAVYRETGERTRLMLDVGGFRADRRARLEKLAAATVAEVQTSGERRALDPMSPFERKVVHDAVAAAGLSSASEGVEPRRYVVVLPAG